MHSVRFKCDIVYCQSNEFVVKLGRGWGFSPKCIYICFCTVVHCGRPLHTIAYKFIHKDQGRSGGKPRNIIINIYFLVFHFSTLIMIPKKKQTLENKFTKLKTFACQKNWKKTTFVNCFRNKFRGKTFSETLKI